jgi:tetratricopeptide (TPR) repeat protein
MYYNFMNFTAPRIVILSLAAMVFLATIGLHAQSGASPDGSAEVTENDAKIYKEAMEWFKKAEAMIGTPREFSNEQAELFLKAIQIKPDFLEAHYNLGLIYAHLKKRKESAAEFEKVLAIDPKFDEGIHILLAASYKELGDNKSAMSALEAGLQLHPKDLKLLKPLAYLQFHNNREAAAIINLQQILEIDPTDITSRMDLAVLFQRSGEWEKAISHYAEVLRVEPKNFAAHYNLGLILHGQKKMNEAAAELDAANRIQPGNAELLERLGDIYAIQNQHAKSAAAYKAALEKAADRSVVYRKLGFSLANLNQPEAAVAALENSARLDSKVPDTYGLLGDLYADLKKNDEAIAAYRKSLDLNPNQKDVRNNLGTLLGEQKKLNEALSEFRIATQLDPDFAAAWSNAAFTSEQLNMDKDAIQSHEKVIALGKAEAQTYFHLGILYAKTNQPDPSIANFTRAIELEPDKYRAMLKEELKSAHSALDSVRYKDKFVRLLAK